MKNHKIKFTTLFLLVILCLQTTMLFSQQSSWKTNQDGWVLRKKSGDTKYERFFAIGLWNVPGYQPNAMEKGADDYRESAKPYLDKSPLYNMVYMSPGDLKFQKERVEITGSIGFYEMLKKYTDNIPNIKPDNDSDYAKRQYMKKHVNDESFVNALDSAIDLLIKQNGSTDHIYAPIDEIANGGAGSGWCWPAVVGNKIKERINKKEKNTLVYTDLVGMPKANTYLFEQQYLQTHDSMPPLPPYEALGKDAVILKDRPLLGFNRAYDGSPLYINGTADYVDYDIETLKKLYFGTLKNTAAGYKGCGDVFGINGFIDFNTYPVLAGTTVDAIKAGIGPKTPVWLFYDGNGYAKPSNMSAEDFIKIIKCQMYTSIIHGATGILFWNDRSNTPEVFNTLEPVIKELQENLNIVYLNTSDWKSKNDLHYMIKVKDKKHSYIIATNTSMTDTIDLHIPNVSKKSLKPLEVYVSLL